MESRSVFNARAALLAGLLAGTSMSAAHAAGFGELQDFLESGLGSFRSLGNVREFVSTIYQREWDAMKKMFAGVEKPFGF